MIAKVFSETANTGRTSVLIGGYRWNCNIYGAAAPMTPFAVLNRRKVIHGWGGGATGIDCDCCG